MFIFNLEIFGNTLLCYALTNPRFMDADDEILQLQKFKVGTPMDKFRTPKPSTYTETSMNKFGVWLITVYTISAWLPITI